MAKLEHPIWERQDCDTPRSWTAFQDYLKLGGNRTISELHGSYVGATRMQSAPTLSEKTLYSWYTTKRWKARAIAWDAQVGAESLNEIKDAIAKQAAQDAQQFMVDLRAIARSRTNRVKQHENNANAVSSIISREMEKARQADGTASLSGAIARLAPMSNLAPLFKIQSDIENLIAKATGGGGGAVELMNIALGLNQILDDAEVIDE